MFQSCNQVSLSNDMRTEEGNEAEGAALGVKKNQKRQT